MVTPIATRFVDWNIPELSTLQDSKVYQLRVQLNEGTPMSRQQKNWLTDSVNSNTYFKRAVPLMGYRFDFVRETTMPFLPACKPSLPISPTN